MAAHLMDGAKRHSPSEPDRTSGENEAKSLTPSAAGTCWNPLGLRQVSKSPLLFPNWLRCWISIYFEVAKGGCHGFFCAVFNPMGQGQDNAGARNNGYHKNSCQINQKKFHSYSFLGWEGMQCTRQREMKLNIAPAKKGIL